MRITVGYESWHSFTFFAPVDRAKEIVRQALGEVRWWILRDGGNKIRATPTNPLWHAAWGVVNGFNWDGVTITFTAEPDAVTHCSLKFFFHSLPIVEAAKKKAAARKTSTCVETIARVARNNNIECN